jgi:5'-methylthioadenosine phosphorylase
MAHVTDYDVWHVSEAPVTVDVIIAVLRRNTQTAQEAVLNLANDLPSERSCDCPRAIETALITDPKRIPPETRLKLDLLVKKYLP